ncbi:hypothetical protein N7450_001009 [Penicillium hetheringtonii]|uniref:Bacteriophage T5 Orf172 DNA-binding domain-containing protein n=1 Tax=Penicillium hetheringtonii TaxID=911720 RepID=A0AAD6GZX2_9EURO|nr:hypothetical protein N7450_001009 [Penicillium hetheringtonii]
MASSLDDFCTFAELSARIPHCAGRTKSSKSLCKRSLPKNRELVKTHIDEIKQEALITVESFAALAKVALCHSHVENASQAQIQWHKECKDARERPHQENEHANQTQKQHIALQIRTKSEDITSDTSDEDGSRDTTDEDTSILISTPLSPIHYTPIARNTSPERIKESVIKIMKQPTNKNDKTPGYVYIISLDDSPGLFKVGYSTKTTEERFRVHRKCHTNITLINETPTPWVSRIEKLVHAELSQSHHHQSRKCQCGRAHKEIFASDLKEIKESLFKWINFFMENTDPYNEDGTLKEDIVLPRPYGREWRMSSTSTPTRKAQQMQGEYTKEKGTSTPETPNNSSIWEISFGIRKLSFW